MINQIVKVLAHHCPTTRTSIVIAPVLEGYRIGYRHYNTDKYPLELTVEELITTEELNCGQAATNNINMTVYTAARKMLTLIEDAKDA